MENEIENCREYFDWTLTQAILRATRELNPQTDKEKLELIEKIKLEFTEKKI